MSNYRTRKSGREEWSGGWSSKLLWTFHVSLLMFMSCFLLNLNYNVYSSSLRQRVQYRLLWLSNHWTDQTDGGGRTRWRGVGSVLFLSWTHVPDIARAAQLAASTYIRRLMDRGNGEDVCIRGGRAPLRPLASHAHSPVCLPSDYLIKRQQTSLLIP